MDEANKNTLKELVAKGNLDAAAKELVNSSQDPKNKDSAIQLLSWIKDLNKRLHVFQNIDERDYSTQIGQARTSIMDMINGQPPSFLPKKNDENFDSEELNRLYDHIIKVMNFASGGFAVSGAAYIATIITKLGVEAIPVPSITGIGIAFLALVPYSFAFLQKEKKFRLSKQSSFR